MCGRHRKIPAPRTAEGLRNGSANQTADAVQDLDGCLENVIDGELAQAVPKSSVAEKLGSAKKLLKAIALFDFEHQALDVLVNDSTPEADLVDVSFRWRGTGDRVPKAMVGGLESAFHRLHDPGRRHGRSGRAYLHRLWRGGVPGLCLQCVPADQARRRWPYDRYLP